MAPEGDITIGEIKSAETSAAVASPAPRTQESAVNTDASTRETPAATTETTDDRYKGWIPPDAHKRIVDGFHQRLDSYGWANGLSREEVEDALALKRQVEAERSRNTSAEPQPDVKDEHGNVYYSKAQGERWAAWRAEQLIKPLEQRLGPILEAHEDSTRRHQALFSQYEEAKHWKDFDMHMDAVTKHLADANRSGSPITLTEAYSRAVVDAEIAKLEPETRKKILAEMNQTTQQAKDEINPGRQPARERKPVTSFGDAIADAVAKARSA